MSGAYDPSLVVLSYLIAVLASYVAFKLASHMAHARGRPKAWWLLSGALAMGTGIWSMHFVGMLAFRLPIEVSYDIPITLSSLLLSVLVSAFALYTINRARLTTRRLVASGVLMGMGIAAMHYAGMAALRMLPAIRYDGVAVAASLVLAIVASVAALHIVFRLRSDDVHHVVRKRFLGAFVMAAAIGGMHYTGMAAAHFAEGSICLGGPPPIKSFWLAATIACCIALMLASILLVHTGEAPTQRSAGRGFGIRLKLSGSYLVSSLLVAGFAVTALWVQLESAEEIATLEAREMAQLLADTIGDDPIVNVGTTSRAITDIRSGRDVFVVDLQHRVVADSAPEEVGSIFTKDHNGAIGLSMADGVARTFTEVHDAPIPAAMQVVLPLRKRTADRSSPIVGALVLEYTPLYVVLLAKARAVAYLVGAMALGFVLLTAVLGSRVAAGIAERLVKLEVGARAIARGRYDVRIDVTSGDEIGALAEAFNKMAQDLDAKHARIVDHQCELEHRVSQRTLEWQLAEAAQRESAAEFRLIAEHMPASLCYVDGAERMRYHNPQFSRLYAMADAAIDGRTVAETLGPAIFAEISVHIEAALDGRQTTFERRHRLPGGEMQDVQTTLVPRVGDDGVVIGYYAMTQDISERKQAEASLRRSNAELTASNVRLREAQNQLLQAEKMASLGQLASGVAHEINNPIGYVNSNLSTLDRYLRDIFSVLASYEDAEAAIVDPVLRARVEAAKREADLEFVKDDLFPLLAQSREGITRVAKIVRDLKNFSRTSNDQAWQWSDLRAGIDSTLNIVWNEIKYKAEVTKDYGELPEIQCRVSQLNQVFMNMMVNAAQAIRQRGSIAIRTGVEGAEVWIEFADSGEGISPEHLPRIFDPFFTTKPVGKGTGLGLSLAYGIVKDHGGRIDVHSVVGAGTTFRIWLPIQHTEAIASNQASGTEADVVAPPARAVPLFALAHAA